jgi:hypothetical protein
MRVFALRFAAAGLAVLLVFPVLAQQPQGRGGRGFGGFGGGMMDAAQLLLNKSVQEELKLTDDQKSALAKVQEKQQEAMQKARDAGDREKAREIFRTVREETKKEVDKWKETGLKPEQAKRLRQIELQTMQVRAFADADVQKELKLTDKQKDEVKEITEGVTKDVTELRNSAQNPRELFPKIQALQKEAKEKVAGLLTEDQKKTWKEMVGDSFEIKFEGRGGPGGGGGFRKGGKNKQESQ